MKLALSHEKGVEILSATGPIASQDAKILKAGLSKILKTGKNKIILDLPGSDDLSSDIIREVADFDALARELSGRIVLASVSPTLKTKIESFAKPPVILCFESRPLALEFLTAPPRSEPASPPSASAQASSPGSEELERFKSEERQLKSHMNELERQNRELKQQVVLATIARRPPASEAEYSEKIALLETRLEKALNDAVAGAAGAKKA